MSTPGEVGRLSAALTLDGAEQFQQKLQQVGQTFTETANKGSAFGRAGEQAVRTAAGATTALTAAAAAYLTILTKTGVAYNSLQQNSRAALSVMLGGATQANEQMDKLDAFARTSPFAKDVFIQAQQQLLGFGVEAQKVIPYLDAIQNAVAATGGSSARVGELSLIMSQIQSSAKITAMDLREFGNRGVDAAELIGSQMGKTAAEIRDEITAGTLDATVALDALAAGMQATFGGTTDLVKEQWTGAVDRVKAANRDLGAALAEPFVSHQGGGMAVSWANQIADVLRAIERQAKPVMEILTWRGMPLFDNLTVSLDKARSAIDRFNPDRIDDGLDRLAAHAPGVAALAGAVLALGANVGPLGKLFGMLNISINPVVAAFVGLVAASPELRSALRELLEAGRPLLPVLGEMATLASGVLSSALPVVADGIRLVVSVIGPLVDLVSQIPAPVLLGVAAFLALHRATSPLEGGLKAVSDGLRGLAERGAGEVVAGTAAQVGALGFAANVAKGGVLSLGAAMKTAFLSNPIGIALTVVTAIVGAWAAANAAAEQKVQEHKSRVAAFKETLNQTTGALTDATKAQLEKNLADTRAAVLAEEMGIAYQDVQQAALGNEDALQRVTEAMQAHADAADLGDENLNSWSASALNAQNRQQELTTILDEQIAAQKEAQEAIRAKIQADRDAAAAMTDSARSNARFNEALEVARDITKDAETRVRALTQALDELKGGTLSAEQAQRRLNEVTLDLKEGLAQTDEAGNSLWASTLNVAGAIDTETRAGQSFSLTMERSRDAMLEAIRAASDTALATGDVASAVEAATAAGNGYVESLRQTMSEAGLTEEQIAGLIGTMDSVPEIVAFLLSDNNTISETEQQLLELAMQIDQTPDKTVTIDEPESPEILKRLEGLGFTVTHLPDGTVSVSAVGIDATESALSYLARPRTVYMSVSSDTAALLRHQGGLDTAQGQHFAQGGMPSGIYRGVMGGIPKMGVDGKLHIFGEKELGVDWETYISPKASRARNAMLLMETARRIGFPMIPASALRGVRGFDQGGTVGSARMPAYTSDEAGPTTNWNMTIVNPVVRDPFDDAWEHAQEKGA